MTDFFLALMLPGAGDELQGHQEGPRRACRHDRGQQGRRRQRQSAPTSPQPNIAARLPHISRRSEHWHPPVLTYSALTETGI